METSFVKSLIIPRSPKSTSSRRVWSIDLESVWLPLFTMTNARGDTTIPHEALGAPLRLALAKDGTIRFSDSGKPVIRVVREVTDMVRLIRDEFTARLVAETTEYATENPDGFKAEITRNLEAGKPLIAHDYGLLKAYAMAKAEAEAMAKAEATPAPAPKPKARKVKSNKPALDTIPEHDRELVAVA